MRPLGLLAVVVCLAAAVPVSAAPTVTFESNAVVATGLTPGANSAWFGISSEPFREPVRIIRAGFLAAADATGGIRTERPNGVPPESIWIVADLANGDTAVAAPPAFKIKPSTIPAAALRRRATGVVPGLELDQDDVELFYIRPRVGAWRASGGGKLALQSMQPVGTSPAPPTDFAADDVIVAVDPFAMTVRTLRVR